MTSMPSIQGTIGYTGPEQTVGDKSWHRVCNTSCTGKLSTHLCADCRVSNNSCCTAGASCFAAAAGLWLTSGLTYGMATIQHHWVVQQLIASCALKAVWCPSCSCRDLHIDVGEATVVVICICLNLATVPHSDVCAVTAAQGNTHHSTPPPLHCAQNKVGEVLNWQGDLCVHQATCTPLVSTSLWS